MMLAYHNLDIEIQAEGIISIDSLHIKQRLNDHGRVRVKAIVEEERAMEIVEHTVSSLAIRISRNDEKKQTIFCGKIEEIRAEKENGLFYLYMDFAGYTREWDLTDKSQSFCRGNDTYEQILTKVLAEYGKAQIRDEVTEGALIPSMLMQYEETDWCFLKRLASHFSTYILADNTAEYGKAYFGIPHMDYGTVLEEEEYTLLKSKERYKKLRDGGDIMPQEMMCWRLQSRRHMMFGEQVMLGYIETVVTSVDIRTERGDLVYEYELSRRKGILTDRESNPRIFGMSIPATIKERKGNQVRVHLDIDSSYEAFDDLKWFTYAIETSNFYCMPEEGSRVHVYFPGHEEQSAMAVHALRTGENSGGISARSGSRSSGTDNEYASNDSGGSSAGGSAGNSEISVWAGNNSGNGGNAPLGGTIETAAGMEAAAAEAEKEEPAEEKDPDYKVFSDPSGSYMELAPYGITFSPGSGLSEMKLRKAGILSLSGLSFNFFSNRNNIFIGLGNPGSVKTVYVKAEESIRLSTTNGDSQIVVNEEINIISAFVRMDAELKNPALPSASQVRASLTATDAFMRAVRNMDSKTALTQMANEYKEALAQKEAEAKWKIAGGVCDVLVVIGGVALMAFTAGAGTPVAAVAIAAATGSFATVSGISDISEGVSDLNKVKNGDLSPSINMMRDGLFGGNEDIYEITKSVNMIIFSVVTCKVIRINLASAANVETTSALISTLQKAEKFRKEHKTALTIFNCTQDFASACYEDYQNTGSLDAKNVIANMGASSLKGAAMSTLRIHGEDPNIYIDIARKIGNGFIETVAGMTIDAVKCDLTGYTFDSVESFQQNMRMATITEMIIADPVDAVSGSFLITEADILLPDVRESIRLERSYSSTRMGSGWLGKGWRFTYEGKLYIDGDIIHGQLPDGFCAAFRYTEEGFADILGNGRYVLAREIGMVEWVIADCHQHKRYCYTKEGLLTAVIDRNGQSLILSYQDGLLCRMQTALGYTVDFEFRDGRLSSMKDDMGRSLQYRYVDGLLTEVIHMDGGVSAYQYSEEGYLIRPID